MNLVFQSHSTILRVQQLPSKFHNNKLIRGGLLFEIRKSPSQSFIQYELTNQSHLTKFINLDLLLQQQHFQQIFEYRRTDQLYQLHISKEELSPQYLIQIKQDGIKSNALLNRVKHEEYSMILKLQEIHQIQGMFTYSLPEIYGWHRFLKY